MPTVEELLAQAAAQADASVQQRVSGVGGGDTADPKAGGDAPAKIGTAAKKSTARPAKKAAATSKTTPAEPAPKPTAGGAGNDESEEDTMPSAEEDRYTRIAMMVAKGLADADQAKRDAEDKRLAEAVAAAVQTVSNGISVPADPAATVLDFSGVPVVQVVNRFGHVVGVAPGELTDPANAGKYLTLQGSQVKTSDGLVDLALVQANLDKYFPPPAEQTPTKSGRKWPIRFK